MSCLRAEYTNLKQLVESCGDDIDKCANGQKAAGTRVRKAMQDLKNKAQTIRGIVMEGRDKSDAAVSE